MRVLLLLASLLMSLVSHAEENDPDPWEGFNRSVFAFNDVLDTYVAKPLAQGYQYVTPEAVDQSVSTFFSNLGDVLVVVNDLGQLKFAQAASDTARFLINSTIGFFGFFDVASHIGLEKHNEDFGQTLGYWGVGSGPYLMLPVLGPSTLRDAGGKGMGYLSGLSYAKIDHTFAQSAGLFTIKSIDGRADLIASEGMISGDKYTFIRSFYLQRREYLVNDGVVEDDFEDFDDFDDEEDDWGDDWDSPAGGDSAGDDF